MATAVVLEILRNVGDGVHRSQLTVKFTCVIALVRTQGGTLRSGQILEHLNRRAVPSCPIVAGIKPMRCP